MTEIERIESWKNETLHKMNAKPQDRMSNLDTLDAKLQSASQEETIEILREALRVCEISGGTEKVTFNL